jgi:hypothetical protein
MSMKNKTAGRLPGPVWLLVRIPSDDRRRAFGPIATLERLRGLARGIAWARPADKIEGIAKAVPEGCQEVAVDPPGDGSFAALEAQTFEQRLIAVLWYDYREGCWDEEKEWNADRWQDVGLLLDDFGIEFPGEDAPRPDDAPDPTGDEQ